MKSNQLTESELFLQKFHLDHPGSTPTVFSNGRTSKGISSYNHLSRLVAQSPYEKIMVIDLACGDGYLLNELSQLCSEKTLELVGVDMSVGELQIARKRNYSCPVTFFESKAQELPLKDESADFILSHMAFMLMDHLEMVVKEVFRCLKPKGIFSAVVSGKFESNEIQEVFLPLLDKYLQAEGKPWLVNLGDRRTRSEEGLKSLFPPAQFSSIQTEDFQLNFFDLPENLINFFMLMYDVDLLSAESQNNLKLELLESLNKKRNFEGKIRISMWLRQITCSKK